MLPRYIQREIPTDLNRLQIYCTPKLEIRLSLGQKLIKFSLPEFSSKFLLFLRKYFFHISYFHLYCSKSKSKDLHTRC